MAHIEIKKNHGLGEKTALERAKTLESKLQEKYGIILEWDGRIAKVKGTGVSGTLAIDDNSVSVEITLGLLLRPMTTKIRTSLEHQLDKALGA